MGSRHQHAASARKGAFEVFEALVPDPVADVVTRDGWKLREGDQTYGDNLYGDSVVDVVPAEYASDAPEKNGFEIINACFDAALKRYPFVTAMGEDVGKLGDVNQGCAGLQEKYGLLRVSDTGIRETTIIGRNFARRPKSIHQTSPGFGWIIEGLDRLGSELPGREQRIPVRRDQFGLGNHQ